VNYILIENHSSYYKFLIVCSVVTLSDKYDDAVSKFMSACPSRMNCLVCLFWIIILCIEYCIQILISKSEGKLLPERQQHRQMLMVNLSLYRPIGLQGVEAPRISR